MWVVKRLNYWKDTKLEQRGGLPLNCPVSLTAPEDGSIGFLAVYDDYKAAFKDAEGDASLITEIRFAVKGERE